MANLNVKKEDIRIVDTMGYGFFITIRGTDDRWYNFFGNRPMNERALERALANCNLSKADVEITEMAW